MSQSLHDIHDILESHSQNSMLGEILAKALKLKELNQEVNNWLPQQYKNKIAVMNFRQGVLVLEVENSAMATHARFLQAELIDFFRKTKKLPHLVSIQWKVKNDM